MVSEAKSSTQHTLFAPLEHLLLELSRDHFARKPKLTPAKVSNGGATFQLIAGSGSTACPQQLPDMWIKMYADATSPHLLSPIRLSVFLLRPKASVNRPSHHCSVLEFLSLRVPEHNEMIVLCLQIWVD